MEVLIARHSGFCEGVKRAYLIAVEKAAAGQPVFMLGNLVHNQEVVRKLVKAGIKIVKALSEIPRGTKGILLISAHGVPPEIYAQAKTTGLEIIDTTCPWVKKAQKIAKEIADEGCAVVIVGDIGHAEVKGLVGWSNGQGLVVQDLADLNKLDLSASNCVGIIAQTTQAEEHFNQLAAALKARVAKVKVENTICGATQKRQHDAVELAKKVDLMLVVGDQMSANTKRLTELCAATGTETHQLETVGQLEKSWLVGKGKVGVTAGASTPEWIIKEVVGLLRAH